MIFPRFLPILALIGCPMSGQQVLHPYGEIAAAGVAHKLTLGATRCDAHGDIYLRVVSAPDVTNQLLVRIGRDGSMATFNPEKVTDSAIHGWVFQDFAVASNAVWLLATISSKSGTLSYVLKFSPQGDYKGDLPLEADLYLEQLAVFDSGDFLISGTERTVRGSKERFQPVTAIFDKTGKFLKRIELEESKSSENSASPPDYTRASAEITLGTAESYGGEIYVLKASAIPLVLVISAGGTVTRQFVLEPPEPRARVAQVRVVQGQIAVEFLKPKPGAAAGKPGEPVFYDASLSEYVVYNAFTGDKIGDYTLGSDLQGSFMCFDGRGGFDFLAETESGTRKIIRAAAR